MGYDVKEFELNKEGVRELLRSPEVEKILVGVAAKLAPDIYKHDSYVGRNRCNSMIYCWDDASYTDNAENNTLLKLISSKVDI